MASIAQRVGDIKKQPMFPSNLEGNSWLIAPSEKNIERSYEKPYSRYKDKFKKIEVVGSILISEINLTINSNLQHIYKEIDHSKYILALQENWDDEGAEVIPKDMWYRSVKFLVDYASWIYETYNEIIETPEINPVRNGSIDLSWRTQNARLLINIVNSESRIAIFYGDQYNDLNSIKGKINIDEFQDYLAIWMRKLKF